MQIENKSTKEWEMLPSKQNLIVLAPQREGFNKDSFWALAYLNQPAD